MSDPVRVDNSIADAIAQLSVPVFHGTRTSMAKRIVADGFSPLTVTAQIEMAAAGHGLSTPAMMADLQSFNRFAVVDPRPDTVFVTGNEVKAGSWADRAPEATWEALWAVYRIRNPHLGWDWNMSDEGHLWVLAQRLDDPPAVLEATAPLGALRNRNSGRTAADGFRGVIESGTSPEDIARQHWLFRISPEWLVDPADITPTGYRVVPSRVDHDLMRFMSGATQETFAEQLRAGYWGEPGVSAGEGDRPWHPFDQVWLRLSDLRQGELEEMVGTLITSQLAAKPDAPM
jgi:hypothetical protein